MIKLIIMHCHGHHTLLFKRLFKTILELVWMSTDTDQGYFIQWQNILLLLFLTMILLTLFKTCTYSLSQESLLYCYKCLIVTIVTPASQLISHLKFNWTHWSCTMHHTKIDHLQNEMTQVFLREFIWWWHNCMERFLLSKLQ